MLIIKKNNIINKKIKNLIKIENKIFLQIMSLRWKLYLKYKFY